LKRQSISARELAKRMDVHESQMSLILSGKRRSLETSTLAKLCRGISTDVRIQSELIRAALADHNIKVDPEFKSKAAKLPIRAQQIMEKLISGQISEANMKLLSDLIERLS
jgi:DNA-binding Xre family transcriptional regulator